MTVGPRPQQAAILIGGKGTRLGTLTSHTPKPLIVVRGRPFVEHLILQMARAGVRRVLLLAGYLPDEVEQWRSGFSLSGVEVSAAIEPAPAGTGGALALAAESLEDRFFMANGDSFFDLDLHDLARPPVPGAVGTVALRPMDPGGRYGRVVLDGERVIAMIPGTPEAAGPINAGVYALSRDILSFIPAGMASLEDQVFPQAAAAGRLFGRTYDGFFIDIGVPEDLARAQAVLPRLDEPRAP